MEVYPERALGEGEGERSLVGAVEPSVGVVPCGEGGWSEADRLEVAEGG